MAKHNPKRNARKVEIERACTNLRSKGIADKDLPDVCRSGNLSGNQSNTRSWLTTKVARMPRWFWVIALPAILIVASFATYLIITGSVFGGQQDEASPYFKFEAYDQYDGVNIGARVNSTLYAVPLNASDEYLDANYNDSIWIGSALVSEAEFNVDDILGDNNWSSSLVAFWVKFNATDDSYWETWARPWRGTLIAYMIQKGTFASTLAYDNELQSLPQTDETEYTVRVNCLDSSKNFNKSLGFGRDYDFARDAYRQLILKVDFDTAPESNWAELVSYYTTARVVGNSLLLAIDTDLVGSNSYTLRLSEDAKSHVTGIDLGYGILTDSFSSILPP